MSWEIITTFRCEKCCKVYGKTDIEYKGIEVWAACDCTPKDRLYVVDIKRIRFPNLHYLIEDAYKGLLQEEEANRDE